MRVLLRGVFPPALRAPYALILVGGPLMIASHATAQSFTGLGFLPGATTSNATAVSGDGTMVLGNGGGGFVWTRATGVQNFPCCASGLNADGSVIVGYSGSGYYAYVWNSAGSVSLGVLPGDLESQAAAVSADGSVVVGESDNDYTYNAFRWTSAGGMINLGGVNAHAAGVSADGAVVVGGSGVTAFRWTSAGGLEDLGGLMSGGESGATAVNADGSVVVGNASFKGGAIAFRWTSASGMVGLGAMPAGTYGSASAVSADGSVVVGSYSNRAFLWTDAWGVLDLQTFLAGLGLNLTGWTLTTANGISTDGLTIVGTGIGPSGRMEGWIATVPTECAADFNHDGRVTVQDIFDFLATWFSGCTSLGPVPCQYGSADFNRDGRITVQDIFDFLEAWFAGCQ